MHGVNDLVPPEQQPSPARQRRVRDRPAGSNIFRVGVNEAIVLFIEDNRVLFLSGKTEVADPADENHLSLLRNTFCPTLQPLSFTTLLVVLNIVLYIVELALGFNATASLLEIKLETLMLLGMNDPHLVYKGEVFRLLVTQFLHINVLHLLSNIFIMLLLVSRLEYTFGVWRVVVAYVVSGVAGDMFSNLLYEDMVRAGSSTSLYGMIGVVIGYLVINWGGMVLVGFVLKFKLILMIVLIGAYLLLFTDVATNIDFYGHLGAFIAGILLSAINPTIESNKREIVLRVIFLILLTAYLLALFLVFYLHPQDRYV